MRQDSGPDVVEDGCWGPLQLRRARATATVVTVSAVLVLLLLNLVLEPQRGRNLVAALLVAASMLALAGMAALGGERTARTVCLVIPVVGVLMLVALNLLTADAGISGLVFFFLPVLYGITNLGLRGAVLSTASAVAGTVVVCLALLPLGEALADATYMSTFIVTLAVLLVRSGRTQRRLVAALRRQASTDALTGLVTRRVLDTALSASLDARDGDVVSLLLLDVDHFKTINDTHGHPVGDDALAHLAGILSRLSRPEDVVARLGGDELGLLLPSSTVDVARHRAGLIVEHVAAEPLVLPDGSRLPLSVSVGVASTHGRHVQIRDLYSAADRSLYAAKVQGRGRVGTPGSVTSSPVPADSAA